MNCIIKSRRTFENLCICPVIEYDVVPQSIYDEVSNISVPSAKEGLFAEGDIVVLDDYIGIIKRISRTRLKTDLACEHIVKLFSRDLVYLAEPTALEPYIKTQIDTHYTMQPDDMYRLPYLNVTAITSTASTMAPDIENGVWSIKAFVSKVRRLQNIFVTFAATRTELLVNISQKVMVQKNLDLSNPAIEILEESYSSFAVARITTRLESGETHDWYLLADGTVTNIYTPDNRAQGNWIVLPITDQAQEEYLVKDEFARNAYSHKILIRVPNRLARFEFYDRVRVVHKGRLFHSYIAAVRRKKNATYTEYQCGELRTLYTDIIQEEL